VLDLATGQTECACRGCALLFDGGGDRYRLIPQRRVRLEPDDRALAALGVPVDLAFVTVGARGVEARYPSPVGLTVHTVPADAWALAGAALEPDVEALLLYRARERWLVPLDDCFRLAALLREHWSGLTGGDAVWREIDRFFAGLEEMT
jgi:hypothetical protein